MRPIGLLLLSAAAAFLMIPGSCREHPGTDDTAIRPVASVTVCNPVTGKMTEYEELHATSSFLVSAVIKSPVTGYVSRCRLTPGDRITKGDVLFQLTTREAAALQGDSLQAPNLGSSLKVKASLGGIIAALEHPEGDFVQEGDPLCTIVLPESLVFLLDVPFELRNTVMTGCAVTVILPDGRQIPTRVRSIMPTMSGTSQTERVILSPLSPPGVPANLIAVARIVKSSRDHAVILPRQAILSDELMKEFWVMKMINDSTAVRVPVTPGIRGRDSISVASPAIGPDDRILTSGNYGLGDTALVRIEKTE